MASYSKLGGFNPSAPGTAKGKEEALQMEIDNAMARQGTRRVYTPGVGGLPGTWKEEQYTYKDPELENISKRADVSRAHRELDIFRGQQRGQEMFGEGSLGRIEQTRSGDISDILAQRKSQSQEGFGAAEFQAAREQRLEGLGRAEQAQLRQLRGLQGAQGIRGGLAAGQTMGLMQKQAQERQSAERDLFLREADLKRQALGEYEQSLRGTEADELMRQQYNFENKRRELMGQLTAMYGEAALGVSERGSAASAQAAKEYARASAAQGGGGKK
jgi:hypothetical protein